MRQNGDQQNLAVGKTSPVDTHLGMQDFFGTNRQKNMVASIHAFLLRLSVGKTIVAGIDSCHMAP
jgi:hypothetical protein